MLNAAVFVSQSLNEFGSRACLRETDTSIEMIFVITLTHGVGRVLGVLIPMERSSFGACMHGRAWAKRWEERAGRI